MQNKYFIAPFVIAVMFFTSMGNIVAQEDTQALSLGYAPVSQELHINPGDTYTDKVTIWNLSESEIEYFIIVRGFKQIEDHPGTAILLSPEEELVSTNSAASWFRFETESVIVPSQYNFELNYLIQVPESATSGEYYAQIFFYTDRTPTETENVVTFNNLGGGPTFLVKTGDEIIENMDLLEFKAINKIYERPDITFGTSISNTGNTHLKPQGIIVLKNMFGQELATVEFNPNKQAIIRDTLATYITEWKSNYLLTDEGKLAFGPITAELTINYKTDSPGYSPVTAETSFWILQWKLGLAILGAIIILVWIIRTVKKSRKKGDPTTVDTTTVSTPDAPSKPVAEEITKEPPKEEEHVNTDVEKIQL